MKFTAALTVALFLFSSKLFAIDAVGIPFGFNQNSGTWGSGPTLSAGVRLHINDLYAIEPLLNFHYEEDNNHTVINLRNLFYFSDINSLQQYAVAGLSFYIEGENGGDDGADLHFGLNLRYGLQHDFTNSPIAIFGEVGTDIAFGDDSHFNSVAGGLGLVFYLR